MVCHHPPFGLGVEFLPAISNVLKDSCGLWLKSLSRSNPLTVFKTMKRFLGSWRIYGRPSPNTRFVGDPRTFVGVDNYNRWCNEWRPTTNNVN